MTPEKNQKKDQKAPLLKTEDSLGLEKANLKNPALLFLILLIPVFLGILFTLTAKAPEEPGAAEPPPVAAPRQGAYIRRGGGMSPVARSEGQMAKVGREMDGKLSRQGCSYRELIGLKPDRDVVAKIRETGRPHRILQPGSQMTMDFSPQRINLELDDQGAIRRVWCG